VSPDCTEAAVVPLNLENDFRNITSFFPTCGDVTNEVGTRNEYDFEISIEPTDLCFDFLKILPTAHRSSRVVVYTR